MGKMSQWGPIGPISPNDAIGQNGPNDFDSYWNYIDNMWRDRLDPTLGSRDPTISLNISSDNNEVQRK